MPKVLLGDVVDHIKDKVDKETTDLEYYVGGEHIDGDEVTVRRKGLIEGSTIGPAFHMRFQQGDVLLMSRNPHLRKASMVDFDGICSDVSYVCRTKDNSILLQSLLPFILQTPEFWQFAEENKKGGLPFFLNWKDFARFEFELHPIDRQQQISDLLWAMERVKNAYRELIARTDDLVKSQFSERFAQKNDDVFMTSVEDCCVNISGGGTPSMSHPEYYGGTIPFIKSGDVKTDRVSEGALWLSDEAVKKTTAKILPTGTVLVVVRSAVLRHEFHIAIADNPLVINQDLKALQPREGIIPEYLLWAIKSREDEILQKVQTMLTSHIEMRDLLNLRVKRATLNEQMAWKAFVQQSDKSKFAAQQTLKELTDAQKAMMKKIFE